jgi:hypothetical protein
MASWVLAGGLADLQSLSAADQGIGVAILSLDLFDRLALYKELKPDQQAELLLASVYNDLRLLVDEPAVRCRQAVRMLREMQEKYATVPGKLAIDLPISRQDWREAVVGASEQLLGTPGFKPYERSIALNLWLTRAGLCPLVHYAFERWFEIGSYGRMVSADVVDDLADLSTTFLFRLIPVEHVPISLARIGTGAYSHVYRSGDGKSIFKVPRNLAARSFASHDEHVASLYAKESGLAAFIPEHLGFDHDTSVIQREFIDGTAGVELLTREDFRNAPLGLDQLEQIYETACEIYRNDGINFDIHPGNMRWRDKDKRWILVDLGPMPTIGADYFPRHSFREYFKKVWLDLHELIASVPIRSLDIEIPLREVAQDARP